MERQANSVDVGEDAHTRRTRCRIGDASRVRSPMQDAAIHLPDGYSLRLMSERDYAEISAICAAVYPSETSYTREELVSHHMVFPEGQFVVVHDESGAVAGTHFTLILRMLDFHLDDSWEVLTARGTFTDHDPAGHALYGADLMVHPAHQHHGIGRALTVAMRGLVREKGLWRATGGSRMPGYHTVVATAHTRRSVQHIVPDARVRPWMCLSAFNTFPAVDPSVCPLPQLSVPHPKKTMMSRRKMLRCCCCYLVHALLLTSLTSSSQWSPQRHTDAIILRFHGNKDHVSRRRRSRQLGNRRFGTIDASKSAFVALSRGGADETLIQRVKHNVVDDHKRRLDDALVRAVDEILRRSLTEGTTITSTMPNIDIVYTGLDRVYSNNVDEVIANSTITREYDEFETSR